MTEVINLKKAIQSIDVVPEAYQKDKHFSHAGRVLLVRPRTELRERMYSIMCVLSSLGKKLAKI